MIKFLDPLGNEAQADKAHSLASAEFVLMLRQKGVQDVHVLRAMEQVARLPFMAQKYHEFADKDYEIPLSNGQTMLRPSLVGRMLENLSVQKHHNILLVGAGTGYICALLARLGKRVTAIERYKSLADQAHLILRQQNYTDIEIVCADGLKGYVEKAPYDRILVTFSLEDEPKHLKMLLKEEGILLTPFGRREERQMLTKFTSQGQEPLRPGITVMSGREGEPHSL
jgi:protein-L-isoaspartate(D-aspartate) O-methyltransferase